MALQEVHQEKKLKGIFKTTSEGRDKATPNCFMFPLPNGAWKVYRFGKGVTEDKSWDQDGEGWTSCYYNRVASLETVCKYYDGVTTNRGFEFETLSKGLEVLRAIGVEIRAAEEFHDRTCEILTNCKGASLIRFERIDGKPRRTKGLDGRFNGSELIEGDSHPGKGWVKGHTKMWEYYLQPDCFGSTEDELEIDEIESLVRATVETSGKSDCLDCISHKAKLRQQAAKHCLQSPWKLVCMPFQPEYPGDRQWNQGAPQFKFAPTEGDHPHWDLVLTQCFDDLTETLKTLHWAIEANIRTGAQYGLAWLAACFQYPHEKLPYLFFFGGQAGGKSTFHEALKDLVTGGIVFGDAAFVQKDIFNGELERTIIAIIDEENLSVDKKVYDQIKKLVTARTIRIRKMRQNAYEVPSTLHFIQTANSLEHCPVFEGDTRITAIEVKGLKNSEMIEKINERLVEEASAFIHTLLNFELPHPCDRFRIPNIKTPSRTKAIRAHQNDLEYFLDEFCENQPGARIRFTDFHKQFSAWAVTNASEAWSTKRISSAINKSLKYKTSQTGGVTYIDNLKMKDHDLH